MSFSPTEGGALYVVQVRHGDSYREHVGSCQFDDLCDALQCGARLRRLLSHGWACDLPDDALALPAELEAMEYDPAACVVEVVRLPEVGPGRYATEGDVLCEVADPCDDPDDALLEPTPLFDQITIQY